MDALGHPPGASFYNVHQGTTLCSHRIDGTNRVPDIHCVH